MKQEAIIASLKKQPVIVVIRLKVNHIDCPLYQKELFSLVERLKINGLKHLEIAWLNHPAWFNLMKDLQSFFKDSISTFMSVVSGISISLKTVVISLNSHMGHMHIKH